MGWFKKLKKTVKKAVRNIVGDDNNRPQRPDASMGPSGDTGARTARRVNPSRARRSRGRDSTIITAGSETGSRTLLG